MNYQNIDMNFKTLTSKTKALKEHFHNGYEIIFITEGKSNFVIENKHYTCDENTLLFLNNLEHHKMNPVTTPYSRYMIIIDSDYLDHIIKDPALLSVFKIRTSNFSNAFKVRKDHVKFIENTLANLNSIFNKKEVFWPMEFTSLLSSFIIFLYREYGEQFPITDVSKKYQRILEVQIYIDEHFKKDITLESIASEFFISKYYLAHSYKNVTGFTINQYVLLKRIAYAKNQLYFTNHSVTDIAMECGFNSQSNFIRVFRKNESMTPLQFRKYHRNSSSIK